MLTLDIEDNTIKMMAVRGRQVETASSLPLEPGLVQDGVIINPSAVGRHISELLAANNITEKKAVVSISGIHAIYRTANVPKLSRSLQEEAAKREMERAMPVALSELYTSWQTINLSDIETAICLVGIPRNTVDAMIDTLHQAGLQPEAMDIRPLALARVTDEPTAIIINAQQISFDIIVMVDGVPDLIRSLPFPSEATLPEEKIEEVKEELDRTISFYNSSHHGGELTTSVATFVSGDLGAMLAPVLERRIKPLPQLLSYGDNLNASEYAANIGLALREARAASPAQVKLNVTPEAYVPKPFPLIQLVSWSFIFVAILVLTLFGIHTFQKYRQTLDMQTQVEAIQAQIQAKQGSQTEIEQLQAKINQAKTDGAAFARTLDEAKTQRAEVNKDLGKITSLLPGIVTLTSIDYSQGATIKGIAPDETIVVDYVRALRNSGQFSQVLISSMTEIEYNRWSFTLTAK